MANALVQQPIILDTDQTVSYRNEPTVKAISGDPTGVFVVNILITATAGVGGAGTILVTDGATTPITLLKIPVASTTTYPIRLEYSIPLQWRDFLVTGLTATGTQMYIWVR